jgi:acetyltransferase
VARLLQGYRNVPPANLDAVVHTLEAVSQLLADIPELAELDINPLLVNHQRAIALDARLRVSAARPAGAANFAIQPYPAALSETLTWGEQTLTLRPIRPEDEAAHREFVDSLSPEDLRMRFFHSRRRLERSELARLVQIDYTREMAFVATTPGPDGRTQTLGVARAITDPDNQQAEFGIIIRPGLKGHGLGQLLMARLIAHLRAAGTQQLVATVLADNDRMRGLAQRLGFSVSPNPDDPATLRLMLALKPDGAAERPARSKDARRRSAGRP